MYTFVVPLNYLPDIFIFIGMSFLPGFIYFFRFGYHCAAVTSHNTPPIEVIFVLFEPYSTRYRWDTCNVREIRHAIFTVSDLPTLGFVTERS